MSEDKKFDYEATVKEIQQVQNQNKNKINALAQAGAQIDPGSLANIKIDTFVQMFLDQEAQAAYVLAMEKNFQDALNQALVQLRQAQLAQGVTPSGLHISR